MSSSLSAETAQTAFASFAIKTTELEFLCEQPDALHTKIRFHMLYFMLCIVLMT
jgi:hypothetical protein